MRPQDRIIVALDTSDLDRLRYLVRHLSPHVGMFKIGLELITAIGVERAVSIVKTYSETDIGVFLDGKFCDIPNTVAAASRNVVAKGVDVFNVHASAGIDAIRAACENKGKAKVLAVTVLTSIDDANAQAIYMRDAASAAVDLGTMAVLSGADGIICSPKELPLFSDLKCLKVTPGVRPDWAAAQDQKRVMTPAEAVRGGATYLVIGRPITDPPKSIGLPADAAERIAAEIAAA